MANKNTGSTGKKSDPANEKANPAGKRTPAQKHALQKRVRKMATPGAKGQFNRMLAMTQPVKK